VVLEFFLGIDSILVFSGHEFPLQDVQGENDVEPEGRLKEVQAPDGSLGTQLEQDGQSGNIWNQQHGRKSLTIRFVKIVPMF